MVKHCCSYGCRNVWKPNQNIQYHSFPLKNPKLLEKWIKAVPLQNFEPSASSVICSEHFTVDSYSESCLIKKRLKKDAVPSLFNYPGAETYLWPKPHSLHCGQCWSEIVKCEKMDIDCDKEKDDLKVEIKIEPTELMFIKEENNVESNDNTETDTLNIPRNTDESLKTIPGKQDITQRDTADGPFGCSLCGSTFRKFYPNLYVHLRMKHHIGQNYFDYILNIKGRNVKMNIEDCELCKLNPSEKCFGGHGKNLARRGFLCSICRYTCASGKMLMHHVYSKHIEVAPSSMIEAEYTCRICIKPFSEEGFEQHMRDHVGITKKYMCRYCDYTTYVKGYTPEHMKLKHNMEISEDFTEKTTCNDLIVGNESASNDLNKTKVKLEPHLDIEDASNDGNSSEEVIKNNGCQIKKECLDDEDKSSKTIITNKNHSKPTALFEKIQDGDVPGYRCKICGKIINERYLMRKHIWQHTDEYPLKCSLCNEKCRLKKSMVFHLRKKHDVIVGIKDIEKDGSLRKKVNKDTNDSGCLKPREFRSSDVQQKDIRISESDAMNKSGFTVMEMGKAKFYKCNICHKEFAERYNFDIHYRDHTKELRHSCFVCDYKAKTKKVAWNHMRRKHKLNVKLKDMPDHSPDEEVKFEEIEYSTEASKSSKTPTLFEEFQDNDVSGYRCKICDKIINEKHLMRKHIWQHTDEYPLKCSLCDQKCRLKKSMLSHLRKKHDIFVRIKDIEKDGSLKKNLNEDTNDSECSNPSKFKSAESTTTEERPYPCSVCAYRAKTKKVAWTHMRRQHKLNVILRDMPDHRPDRRKKPVKCIAEASKFRNKSGFTIVERDKTRLYKCNDCHKEFTARSIFDVHYLDHTGERPHSCFVCDYKAKTKKVAWNHMRRKHKLNVKLKDMPNHRPRRKVKFQQVEYSAEASKFRGSERYTLVNGSTDKLKCVICDRLLSRRYFTAHYRLHTVLREASCSICDFKALTAKSVERHVKEEHDFL